MNKISRWQSHTAKILWAMLLAFIVLFLLSRLMVFLIMMGYVPNLYLYIHGVHIHHFVYGIFILVGVCAYLLFWWHPEKGRPSKPASFAYGAALALLFDEFDMWLHLGGSYYGQLSFDAVVILVLLISMSLLLIKLEKFGVDTAWEIVGTALLLTGLSAALFWGLHSSHKAKLDNFKRIEMQSPQ